MKEKQLTVLDVFCGAGGFSEGFRQQGFEIIMGIDKWESAIHTFNHNFNLDNKPYNVLELANDIKAIEKLPDTNIIVGSPPCVSFSSSNRSGKADKSLGVRLTEAFLKIIVVKKFKKNGMLQAWFMENVANSLHYLQDHYTFRDLGLEAWARNNGHRSNKRVVSIKGNSTLINSAEYGAPQSRERAITGEILVKKSFVLPEKTHSIEHTSTKLPTALTIGYIKSILPSPTSKKRNHKVIDPLYSWVELDWEQLTDHFYDTGLYECEWRNSYFMKRNHPYMGRMSFPENENKPSRTLTATNIGTSREAIIYRSEFKRKGDGEYRVPTVREMATLMGFPITFQFVSVSERTKCRLIGNAVCVSVSRALAQMVRKELGLPKIKTPLINKNPKLQGVINLNSFSEKSFKSPPKKKQGSRFRRHPFKDGNITVTLSNYPIEGNQKKGGEWVTSVQYGNGNGFPTFNFPNDYYLQIEPLVEKQEKGIEFLNTIKNGFSEKIADGDHLQKMYEHQTSDGSYLEPTVLIERIGEIINDLNVEELEFIQNGEKIFKKRERIPLKQLFALYVINRISSLANK